MRTNYVINLVCLLLSMSICLPSLKSQTGLNTTLVGRWPNGPCQAVAVEGSRAYFGNGAYLVIADVSNPNNPVELGKLVLPGPVTGIALASGFAYIADWHDGLRIVDVSDPTSPVEVGFFDTPNLAKGVAVNGGFAYIADNFDGLRIIDVSNPANPVGIGFYDTFGFAEGVAYEGGFAYVADDNQGLRIINVSDPANPSEVGSVNTPGRAFGVAVSGGIAYVADGVALRIIDVSDPASPNEISSLITPGNAQGVAISNGFAYVADWFAGLRIIDISDPANPSEVGFLDTPDLARGVVVGNGFAFIANKAAGMRIIDVSNPSNPNQAGFVPAPDLAEDIAVSGGFAYVANWSTGLSIIDVSDPANPVETAFVDTPSLARGLAIEASFVYLADWFAGLRIIDVGDPFNPVEVGFLDTPGFALNVSVSDGFAYVADDDEGLRIIDVSDPANPSEVGFINTPGRALGLAVSNSFVYVADNGALRIIDVSDPANPNEVGAFTTPGSVADVAVTGSIAYMAEGSGGLRIIDVSNPANPNEVGFVSTPGLAYDVKVSDDFAYIANSFAGLRIFDVSDPGNPHEVGFYETGDYAYGVAVSGGVAYVADWQDGIYIVQNELLNVSGQYFTTITTGAIVNDLGISIGSAWGDYDDNGYLDLFVANSGNSGDYNFLYSNNGDGTFIKITAGDIVNRSGSGRNCSWGDYDNDADLDIFITNGNGEDNFFYANNGDRSFTRITSGILVNDGGNSGTCSWGDYDNDGYLDLFVANGSSEKNFLYHNEGNGTFTKIAAGDIVNEELSSGGGVWGDYDNDGDLDLFVANASIDPSLSKNSLFENNGDGTFAKITTGDIVNDIGSSNCGSWGDYNNDGFLDLFVTNGFNQKNDLYENNKNGTFTKITLGAVVNDTASSLSSSWGDFDNDGYLDLFVANAFDQINNILYKNNGDGTFTKIDTGVIYNDGGESRGSCWGDYDKDGDLDLFVANTGNQNNSLYANNGNSNSWINIKCIGTLSNTSAIGTKVRIKATFNGNEIWQLTEISGQSGNRSQNSLNAEFGLGNAIIIDSMLIQWPSGIDEVFTSIGVNQFITITEGQGITGIVSNNVIPMKFELFQNYPNPFNPITTISYRLPTSSVVKLTIYNHLGKKIITLVNSRQTGGVHEIQWNGKNGDNIQVASGVYLYRLKVGQFIQTRKMILVR